MRRPLTPREREVVMALTLGATDKEIAEALKISHHTVKDHVASSLAKLGAANRYHAVGIALREGIL